MSPAPKKPRRSGGAVVLQPGQAPSAGSVLDQRLSTFRRDNSIVGKGRLSQMVYLSRMARDRGLPLDAATLLAASGGQIKGASGSAVGSILAAYGITRRLSTEGGRTSRGSVGYLPAYIQALNELHADREADTAQIEAWWVQRVREFFDSGPFTLRFDASKNLRTVVRDLILQAEHRQRSAPGTMYVGAVLQHLVGAKLELCLPAVSVQHHSFSTADAPTNRGGDFVIRDTAIHVTTSPTESLMQKCRENINSGALHQVIITTYRKLPAAEALAESAGIQDHIELFDVEQFLATNLLELGGFEASNRRIKIDELIARYNAIIDAVETDPSLKIAV